MAARRRGGRHVVNPVTGRLISVASGQYNLLLRSGVMADIGEEELVPVFRTGIVMTVTNVFDPSNLEDVVERRGTQFVLDPQATAAANRFVRGEPWATTLGANGHLPLWYARFAARFTFGNVPTVYARNPDDHDGPGVPPDPAGIQEQIRFMNDIGQFQNRASNPWMLPIKDLDLNQDLDDDEGRCMTRFAGMPVSRNVAEAIRQLDQANIPAVVYDMFGNVWFKTRHPLQNKRMRRGVSAGGHMYILNAKRVELVNEPKFPLEMMQPTPADWCRANRQIMWRDGRSYHTSLGVFSDNIDLEPWMMELMKLIPRGSGFDLRVLETFQRSTVQLDYEDPMLNVLWDPDNYFAIDIAKCYWRVFDACVHGFCGFGFFKPNLFTVWRPYNDEEVTTRAFYRTSSDLSFLGLTTAIIPGHTVLLLQQYGVEVNLTAWLPMEFGPLTDRRLRAMCAEIRRDDDKMRGYRLINGVFGRVQLIKDVWVLLPEIHPVEAHWYRSHGRTVINNVVQEADACMNLVSNYYIHVSVVHLANYMVLRKRFKIEQSHGLRPVKVKTDALVYPFDTDLALKSACGDMDDYDEVNGGQQPRLLCRWVMQDLPDQLPRYYPFTWSPCTDVLIPHMGTGNASFLGAPGTGKTTIALGLFDSPMRPPEYAITMTNRGVMRLKEKCRLHGIPTTCMTIHKFLGIGISDKQPINPWVLQRKYANETIVLVDEYQSVPTKYWTMLQMLWNGGRGVFFRFCGDENQVSAIEDVIYKTSWTPWMGERHEMKHDYRNDPALIQAREELLEQCLEVNYIWSPYGDPVHQMNIAFRVPTVERVNAMYVSKHRLEWGDDGRYVVLKQSKRYGLETGELLIRHGDTMRRWCGGDSVVLPLSVMKALRDSKILDWGWAVTIHKMLGETITEPYTIWDWDDDCYLPNYARVKYTALTRGRVLDAIEFRGPFDDIAVRIT